MAIYYNNEAWFITIWIKKSNLIRFPIFLMYVSNSNK